MGDSTGQKLFPVCSMGMGTLFCDEEDLSTVSVSIQPFVLRYRECTYSDTGVVLPYIDIY